MAQVDQLKGWVRRQGSPVTIGFLASLLAMSLLLWFLRGGPIEALAFGGNLFRQPWAILTYPWAYLPLVRPFGIIEVLFLGLILIQFGGSAERELGSRKFGLFLLSMIAVPPLAVGLGALILGSSLTLAGPWLAVGGIIVAWATRNPNAPVMLWGIIPLLGKWIGVLVAAGTLFGYGFGNPALGVLACAHLVLAYLFASNRIGGLRYSAPVSAPYKPSKAQLERERQMEADIARRKQEREERERLRKLFGED